MPLLEPGQQVGSWTVVRFIDAGGNGEVWEVENAERGHAALKVLLDRRASSVAYRRFRREIETVQRLEERSGVLPILDAHLPEDPSRRNRAWYTMPLAQALEDALENQPVARVVEAIATLAEVMAELHDQGIIHRDIKPPNLLWYADGPALGDFGLVYIPDAESLTEPGRVPGAFGYIADEVMLDPEAPAAPPADVFALAKVLWKLLTPGATFPPQGSLRADGGPSTLTRSLTVAHADALDRILEAATRAADTRIGMIQLANELRAWLSLPAPAGLPAGLDAALAAARQSMAAAVRERDLASAHERAVSTLQQLLVDRSESLLEAVSSIDPTGAQVGPLAIGPLRQVIEQPSEGWGEQYGTPFHHGVRVTRSDRYAYDDILVVAFCLQVTDAGRGVVSGLLMTGNEQIGGANDFRQPTTREGEVGVELEVAIEAIVTEAAQELGPLLESFAARAEQ